MRTTFRVFCKFRHSTTSYFVKYLSLIVISLVTSSAILSAEQPIEKGYKIVNGVSLYYESIGEGVPIVVVHGGPGLDHSYLLPQMGELAKGYRLIFYDQRAMGKSSAEFDSSQMTMNSFVEDLEGIRKAFGLDKMNLMGHSWGGLVSMFYAIRYPSHLQSLILVNTTPASSVLRNLSFGVMSLKTTKEDSIAQLQIAETDGFKKRDPATMARFFRLLFHGSFHNKQYAESLTLNFDSSYSAKSAMVRQLNRDSTLRSYDIFAKLDTIQCPVLIIGGSDDAVVPGANENIRDHIRGAQYILMPECGHFPFVESPGKFFPAVRTFLKNSAQRDF
jgi:proline iminopeptidase